MKINAFSLAVDGLNDNGLEKMNLLTVRIYVEASGKIVTRFLDMCATSESYLSHFWEGGHDISNVFVSVNSLSNMFLSEENLGVIDEENDLEEQVVNQEPIVEQPEERQGFSLVYN